MAIFLAYEGDPSDPMQQTVIAVEAEDEKMVLGMLPHAIAVQKYEEPSLGEPPDLVKLKRSAQPVWSF